MSTIGPATNPAVAAVAAAVLSAQQQQHQHQHQQHHQQNQQHAQNFNNTLLNINQSNNHNQMIFNQQPHLSTLHQLMATQNFFNTISNEQRLIADSLQMGILQQQQQKQPPQTQGQLEIPKNLQVGLFEQLGSLFILFNNLKICQY